MNTIIMGEFEIMDKNITSKNVFDNLFADVELIREYWAAGNLVAYKAKLEQVIKTLQDSKDIVKTQLWKKL